MRIKEKGVEMYLELDEELREIWLGVSVRFRLEILEGCSGLYWKRSRYRSGYNLCMVRGDMGLVSGSGPLDSWSVGGVSVTSGGTGGPRLINSRNYMGMIVHNPIVHQPIVYNPASSGSLTWVPPGPVVSNYGTNLFMDSTNMPAVAEEFLDGILLWAHHCLSGYRRFISGEEYISDSMVSISNLLEKGEYADLEVGSDYLRCSVDGVRYEYAGDLWECCLRFAGELDRDLGRKLMLSLVDFKDAEGIRVMENGAKILSLGSFNYSFVSSKFLSYSLISQQVSDASKYVQRYLFSCRLVEGNYDLYIRYKV